ncbi:hypothetical protein BDE02_05G090300 [Populus trichocarpa]|nr:hypothetical protein BDE02_05G090300 [Populus trichocarpa]
MDPPPKKINLISCEPLAHVSDIKLIRTDTTLDLSQKAEKGMIDSELVSFLYSELLLVPFAFFPYGTTEYRLGLFCACHN